MLLQNIEVAVPQSSYTLLQLWLRGLRPHTLNREVPVSNLLVVVVVPSGKPHHLYCLVLGKGSWWFCI